MKIASINIYAGNKQLAKDIRTIKSLDLDVFGVQEASRRFNMLANGFDRGYRVFAPKSSIRGAKDCTTFVSRRLKVVAHSTKIISQAAAPKRVAPARWLTAVVVEEGGERYAFLNVHLHASIQNRRTGNPLNARRVNQYIKGIQEIERQIGAYQKAGYKVIVVGDFNYRIFKVRAFRLWRYSPQSLFERCGLQFISDKLDYIAFSKSLKIKSRKNIPTSQTGADHPWLILDLVPKRVDKTR